jgi:alkylation response protein AidB-like acyl-CoA dehydrogenase
VTSTTSGGATTTAVRDSDRSRRTPADPQTAARILAEVTSFVPTLRERALATEELGRVLPETIEDLDRIGVFKMSVPVEYGGYALTPTQQHAVYAEIARGCGSTGWVAWVTGAATQWVTLFDRRCQEEAYPEGWVGPLNSGVVNPAGPGTARRVSGGYMLKGKWPFCSGGHYTAFHHLGALLSGEGEQPPILCQVPHDQVRVLDDWDVVGLRGSGSNTVVIDEEVFVPEHRVRSLPELVMGERIEPAPEGLLYRIPFLQFTTVTLSAVPLGIARGAYEAFQAKLDKRGITASPYSKQSEAPITHIQLGELHCKLLAAELLGANSLSEIERLAAEETPPSEIDLQRPKVTTAYLTKLCTEVTELILRASGASSIHRRSPFQRHFLDVRTVSIHGQTNIETNLEDFGRTLLGITAVA